MISTESGLYVRNESYEGKSTSSRRYSFESEKSDFQNIFKYYSRGQDLIDIEEMMDMMDYHGFSMQDKRWKEYFSELKKYQRIDSVTFMSCLQSKITVLSKAAQHELIIPKFYDFTRELISLFRQAKSIDEGQNAQYISQLQNVDPEKMALSVCSIDGQTFSVGDYTDQVCIQSCQNPISYGIALQLLGGNYVHQFVDRQPSGSSNTSFILTQQKLAYNPIYNPGALTICALLLNHFESTNSKEPSKAFDSIIDWWKKLMAGEQPGFNNSIFISEQKTSDKNFSLAYALKAENVIPPKTNITECLQLYFQLCSLETTTQNLSIIAATLANGGVNPISNERVFTAATTKDIVSIMFACGMYDYSGQFAFKVGLPGKSSVSGLLMLIVPGVCGFAIWSPKIDGKGNSPRCIKLAQVISDQFKFHTFNGIGYDQDETQENHDPVLQVKKLQYQKIIAFLYACAQNDLYSVQKMIASGFEVNLIDYDKRTGLHLAASQGHQETVEYLLSVGADSNIKDKQGNTPFQDALNSQNKEVIQIFENLQQNQPQQSLVKSASAKQIYISPEKTQQNRLNFQNLQLQSSSNSNFEPKIVNFQIEN